MYMRPGTNMWLNTWIKNRWLWRVLFLAAIVYFVVRGPWRAIHDSGDFLLVFTAARCWLHGANPYVPADLAVAAQAAGIQVTAAHFVTNPMVYLPPALPLLSPLALLPWSAAKAMWLACLLALSLWSMMLLARNADAWKLPVATLLLAFAPLHTGLGKGQPSVLVCGLLCLSMFTSNPYAAGLMLGVAACMKPQLVVGFLLLALFQREYRKLIVACTFGLATIAVALLLIAPGWFPALTVNTREIVGGASGLNDLNPTSWYQLINLHILVPQALYRTPVEIIAYAIIILVTAFAIARVADYKMAAALIASATVLVGYHRFYDAQILWLAIPAILLLTQKRLSRCLWACYAVFLIPGQTMAALRFGTRTGDPWSWLLLRHETLAILIVWMLLASIAIARSDIRTAATAFRPQPLAAP